MELEKVSQLLTRNAILGRGNSLSRAPGSRSLGHVCRVASCGICSVGCVNGNMRGRGRLRYLNVMIKIWTLLNSRETLKDFEVEDQ